MTVLSTIKDDLFNLDLIRSYVDRELNPRFVERHWLKQQIEDKLANPDHRFLLLTAEPGAGKSAFMAWLAHQHPDWCRYFIRRDQRTPLGDVGTYSFLLQVGFQLATTYPDLFKQEQIKLVVEQRIGTAINSEIVAAEITKMFASPFYEKVIQIQQQVTHSKDTNITGVRIGEFYASERDLPIKNLQFMALFDPARAMMKQVQAKKHPHRQIVVLVDALDELRDQDNELSLLKWLTNCPELPANLRFVLTCRPDDDLLRAFRGTQQSRIQEISIAEEDPDVTKDLTCYTRLLIKTPEVNQTLIEMHQDLDNFTHQAVTKANGNFGYLGAIGRAVDEAIRQNQQDLLREILGLSELPGTLQDLYAFFLSKIKDAVAKERVPVEDAEGETSYVQVWSAVYKPILGILSVAFEPLTPTQIQKLGLIQVEFDYVIEAIEKLQQFLDQLGNCYRLYHSTLPEFFTSPKTKERTDYSYCYVDAVKQNQRIVKYYQAGAKFWAEVNLKKIAEDDYGRRHLAQHLVKADRVEELHTLLATELDGRNAWFTLKEAQGDTEGFVRDVQLAWEQANTAFLQKLGVTIPLQCRYALITASLNSLATNIPASLIARLVEEALWTPAQGLAYAQQVKESNHRAEVLTALAPHLPKFLLSIALEAACVIQDDSDRTKALIGLVSHFPEVLPEALKTARGIQDESWRALALGGLAPFSPEVLQEALEAARGVQDELWRALALSGLAPFSPEASREVFDGVNDINTGSFQTWLWNGMGFFSGFSELAPYLPEKLLRQALEIVRDFESGMVSASTLEALARHLPEELLQQAFDVACSIQDEYSRAKALSGLAPHLPEELLQKVFNVADGIQDDFSRAEVLSGLVPRLPKILNKALNVAGNIQDDSSRAEALSKLAPYLPKELLPQTLEAALSIKFSSFTDNTEFISRLAPYLRNNALLQQALDIARGIQDGSTRADFISRLVPYLPKELLQQALDIVRSIQDDLDRVDTLRELASHLPQELLPITLEAALSIQDDSNRVKALSELVPYFPAIIQEAFDTICGIQDDYDRAEFLKKLAPSLPEELLQKAVSIARSIQGEYPRAKALSGLAPYLPEVPLLMLINSITLNLVGERVSKLVVKSEVLQESLDIACGIQEGFIRAEFLGELAPHLSQTMLQQALKAALNIQDEHWRALALSGLAPYLPEARTLALNAVIDVKSDEGIAKLLIKLVPFLSEEGLRFILDTSQHMRISSRSKLLKELAPLLPEAREEALNLILNIQDYDYSDYDFGTALEELAPLLQKSILLQQVLDIACDIQKDQDRAHALNALIPYLSQSMLQQALNAARGIQHYYYRANVFSSLLPVFNLTSFELWHEILYNLSYRHRNDLLHDIHKLSNAIIALGGTQALTGTILPIQEVCRQWR